MNNKKKTIVLGITGGIAAFKVLGLIKILKNQDYNVIVIMTKSASEMVNEKEFEKASGNKVYTQLFEKNFDYKKVLEKREVDHIQIADSAELLVIIPTTANVIGKIANGIADDFLTTTILATTAPILVCPSMNVHMWMNPIVQANIKKAKTYGFQFIDPESGSLACGYEGQGRLADINKIAEEINALLNVTTSLKGKKIIVTAGGTTEPIDDIRFITNRSSGKMGVAIAEACFRRGAEVLLLKANSAVSSRYLIPTETYTTADELSELLKKHVANYAICFHSAAVSDFSISKQTGKIKSNESVTLELKPREKLLAVIKRVNPHIKLYAFKAEWESDKNKLVGIAKEKIEEYSLDGVLANDVSQKDQGFEADKNEIIFVDKRGVSELFSLQSKMELAEKIVDFIKF